MHAQQLVTPELWFSTLADSIYAETYFLNETKLEVNNYNDSINLKLETDCFYSEFSVLFLQRGRTTK